MPVSTIDQTGHLDWDIICKSCDPCVMERGLPMYLLCHAREQKEEVHYDGKTMRESTLYMFGRTGEGVLFG